MNQLLNKVKNRKPTSEDGFTLVELSITILIIGLLAAIGIPIYSNQVNQAIKSQVREDVSSTVSSLKRWQNSEDVFNKIPAAGAETNDVVVRTDTATTITIRAYNTGDPDNVDFCVEGSKTIGGAAFRYSYSITTGKATEGALCTAAPVLPPETFG
jgi:prepilin-type N-terminal cleavage/methylation domain-containing protein